MLIFWNCAGVPLVYCFNSYYILKHGPFEHSTPYTVFCFALLIVAYYIWDTCNSQKVRSRCGSRFYLHVDG
jgi:delta24(24(1))-sterol reductase